MLNSLLKVRLNYLSLVFSKGNNIKNCWQIIKKCATKNFFKNQYILKVRQLINNNYIKLKSLV